ncbi:MAG TPA: NADPH:quinone oxidoreductase [Cytophagales bacterium]|nr:NADPH:quinone oxidoreductase [Cytophagales bacterium]
MKAILCKELGLPETLSYEEVDLGTPKENEILIEVKACSVNYPDTLIIQGLYQFKPELPFTPGSDVAGIVKEVGADVKGFQPGDEVFSIVPYGGFAEEVLAPANRVFPKPPTLDFKLAASFTLTYGTSYHALKDRAKLQAGETLLVLGAAGGVGLAAVELGKQMGATVIAAASSQEKLDLCQTYGADHTINYAEEDLKERVKQLTEGKGADVVYDPIGGKYTEAALRATAWEGRFLIVGFPAGIASIPMNLPLLKGCDIMGVFWGRFTEVAPKQNMQNMQEIMGMLLTGKLKPHIDKVYPLQETPQALRDLMNRKAKGKIILEP